MFVTFVMAVLMFAVSPLSAAPNCDSDGDEYFRDKGKGCDGVPFDPNDSDPCDPDPEADACDVVSSDGDMYTAKLLSGAFIFVDGGGVPIIDPIEVISGGSGDIGLVPLEDDVEMWRPTGPDDQATRDLQATWDRMFYIGCPELGTSIGVEGFKIMKIKSTYNDWSFEEPGNIRLILRDIRLKAGGVDWDVTVQLIGKPNNDPYPDSHWLPADGSAHVFKLTRGTMFGREVSGGPGGRESCHQGDSGTEERMVGFFLYDPQACTNQDCRDDASSVMQIVNPEGD